MEKVLLTQELTVEKEKFGNVPNFYRFLYLKAPLNILIFVTVTHLCFEIYRVGGICDNVTQIEATSITACGIFFDDLVRLNCRGSSPTSRKARKLKWYGQPYFDPNGWNISYGLTSHVARQWCLANQ